MKRFEVDERTATLEDVTCVRETELAMLCEVPEAGRTLWVPKSLVDEDSEVRGRGQEGCLIVARWFAVKEKLVES